MEDAQLLVVQLDRWHGPSLTPGGRLVLASPRRADRDPLQPVVACDRLARHLRVDSDGHPLADLDLLTVDDQVPRAANVDVDLLLVRRPLVVLEALRARREIEVVDAERGHAEGSPHLLDNAVQLVPTGHV